MVNKPHAICIPSPFQSHINSMFKFAKLLHHKGFHITFVNTEFNQKCFLRSRSADDDTNNNPHPDFQFETIPDGLIPPSDPDSAQNSASLIQSIHHNFLGPFTDLVVKLNNKTSLPDVPPVSCIVSDVAMPFTVTAADNLGGIPLVMLVTISACAFMVFKQFPALVENGLIPLRDESLLTTEYLDQVIDWIPGMNDISIRHLPPQVRQTNPQGWLLDHYKEVAEQSCRASAIVFHTIDALEQQVLNAFAPMFPKMYTIAPLQLLLNQQPQEDEKDGFNCSLWKEESECLEWLDSKKPNSVVYVSFGSVASIKKEQLIEFGMGLAKTSYPFLWIIRHNMVIGESSLLPSEFVEEIKDRGFVANWCPQEKVLNHPSIGCFVTLCTSRVPEAGPGLSMHEEIWYRPDMFFYRDMLVMLARNKKVEEARRVWLDLKGEEVLFDQHTFGDIVRVFLDSGLPEEAMEIYEEMRQSPDPPLSLPFRVILKGLIPYLELREKVKDDFLELFPNMMVYDPAEDLFEGQEFRSERESDDV